MAIFNISSKTSYNLPKAKWSTGNLRDNLIVKPEPVPYKDYTDCVFGFSNSGLLGLISRVCIIKTEALHGSQSSKDILYIL